MGQRCLSCLRFVTCIEGLVILQAKQLILATTPEDSYLIREVPFDVDCSVLVGVDYSTALFANIDSVIHAAGLLSFILYATSLARVVFLHFHNADTF